MRVLIQHTPTGLNYRLEDGEAVADAPIELGGVVDFETFTLRLKTAQRTARRLLVRAQADLAREPDPAGDGI